VKGGLNRRGFGLRTLGLSLARIPFIQSFEHLNRYADFLIKQGATDGVGFYTLLHGEPFVTLCRHAAYACLYVRPEGSITFFEEGTGQSLTLFCTLMPVNNAGLTDMCQKWMLT
jgi:hypothetical protein